ncbi:ORF251 [White spot syndrome virus]|uniref:Wsv210 n=3 Tax=White spot syndrome virus TaxID=342409 RepID=Q8VB04_WSSVS|nr:wsv210 [Shrimp white spot syndrome virus]AFX59587.1 wsv210 [White spot syndrome virus]AAL33214.1 wsv210 [Shrimp white spot syndrome virus]AAL89133.1 WSSV265 [Shrimp white spot syndrome virus]ATU83847.1 ORF251 [White spot syndrome virus]AWQ60382.1 wsv210 [Shrimp white spot syndrome virus]
MRGKRECLFPLLGVAAIGSVLFLPPPFTLGQNKPLVQLQFSFSPNSPILSNMFLLLGSCISKILFSPILAGSSRVCSST